MSNSADQPEPSPDPPGAVAPHSMRRAFGGFWDILTGPCRFCGGAMGRWNSGPRQIHPTQEDDGKEGARHE
jgi:hypothetical protein